MYSSMGAGGSSSFNVIPSFRSHSSNSGAQERNYSRVSAFEMDDYYGSSSGGRFGNWSSSRNSYGGPQKPNWQKLVLIGVVVSALSLGIFWRSSPAEEVASLDYSYTYNNDNDYDSSSSSSSSSGNLRGNNNEYDKPQYNPPTYDNKPPASESTTIVYPNRNPDNPQHDVHAPPPLDISGPPHHHANQDAYDMIHNHDGSDFHTLNQHHSPNPNKPYSHHPQDINSPYATPNYKTPQVVPSPPANLNMECVHLPHANHVPPQCEDACMPAECCWNGGVHGGNKVCTAATRMHCPFYLKACSPWKDDLLEIVALESNKNGNLTFQLEPPPSAEPPTYEDISAECIKHPSEKIQAVCGDGDGSEKVKSECLRVACQEGVEAAETYLIANSNALETVSPMSNTSTTDGLKGDDLHECSHDEEAYPELKTPCQNATSYLTDSDLETCILVACKDGLDAAQTFVEEHSLTLIPEPPTDIEVQCGQEALRTVPGFENCASSCKVAECCWKKGSTKSCTEHQVCASYAACLNLEDKDHDHTDIGDELDEKCTDEKLGTEQGRNQCIFVCMHASCCFDDEVSCPPPHDEDEDDFCALYEPCGKVFDNNTDTTSTTTTTTTEENGLVETTTTEAIPGTNETLSVTRASPSQDDAGDDEEEGTVVNATTTTETADTYVPVTELLLPPPPLSPQQQQGNDNYEAPPTLVASPWGDRPAPNTELMELVVPPPIEALQMICTQENVATTDGMEECQALCEPAQCCRYDSVKARSCVDGHQDDCQTYRLYCHEPPPAVTEEGEEHDEDETTSEGTGESEEEEEESEEEESQAEEEPDNNSDASSPWGHKPHQGAVLTAFARPPLTLETTCVQEVVATQEGFDACAELCQAGQCCRLDSPGSTCEKEHSQDCLTYLQFCDSPPPALKIPFAAAPQDIAHLCSEAYKQTPEGANACANACRGGTCCRYPDSLGDLSCALSMKGLCQDYEPYCSGYISNPDTPNLDDLGLIPPLEPPEGTVTPADADEANGQAFVTEPPEEGGPTDDEGEDDFGDFDIVDQDLLDEELDEIEGFDLEDIDDQVEEEDGEMLDEMEENEEAWEEEMEELGMEMDEIEEEMEELENENGFYGEDGAELDMLGDSTGYDTGDETEDELPIIDVGTEPQDFEDFDRGDGYGDEEEQDEEGDDYADDEEGDDYAGDGEGDDDEGDDEGDDYEDGGDEDGDDYADDETAADDDEDTV